MNKSTEIKKDNYEEIFSKSEIIAAFQKNQKEKIEELLDDTYFWINMQECMTEIPNQNHVINSLMDSGVQLA